MASWLKSAEGLLHAVDKTAKAVHSVAKQQAGSGNDLQAADQAQPQPVAPPKQRSRPPSRRSLDSSNTNDTKQSTAATADTSQAPAVSTKTVNKPAASKPTNEAAIDTAPPPPQQKPSTTASQSTTAAKPPSSTINKPDTSVKPPVAATPVNTTTTTHIDILKRKLSSHAVDSVDTSTPGSNSPGTDAEQPTAESSSDGPSAAAAPLSTSTSNSTTTKDKVTQAITAAATQQDTPSSAAAAVVVVDTETVPQIKDQTTTEPLLEAVGSTTTTSINNNELTPTDSTTTNTTTINEREARLAKAVETLKKKLKRVEEENHQLEDMLSQADAQARGGTGEISRLEDSLAKEQAARITAQAALTHATAAKDTEIAALKEELALAKTELATANERMAELLSSHDTLVEEKKVSEGALLAAVRREMEAVEAQLQEERAAHAATRRAGAAREQELDTSVADASHALAATQRALDERSSQLAVLEERCIALEAETDSLHVQLTQALAKVEQYIGAEAANGSGATAAAAAVASAAATQQIETLEAALTTSQRRVAELETAAIASATEATSLKEEIRHLRQEVSGIKAVDVEDLKRRLREVTDALYLKQTQLERVNAEQAATRLALERQVATARAEAQQVRRRASATDRALVAAEDGVVPTDAVLGDAYQRLASAHPGVGGAVMATVKLLDDSASQSMRVLRRYPLARLIVLVYVLFIHMFCYALLHRLQHKAFQMHELEMHAMAVGGSGGDLGDVLHHGGGDVLHHG